MTIIDEIKARARIEDVIGADVKLRKSGASFTGFCPFHENKDTASFVVYPNNGDDGIWKCFGVCNESGDVIAYIEKKNPGWDTREAIRYLAEMYKIDLPSAKVDLGGRLAAASAGDVRRAAMNVMRKWLAGDTDRKSKEVLREGDKAALAYALDRGWKVETLRFEGVGFSGNATAAEYKEMREEFKMRGIDPLCPAAVMVLGFEGDVAAWANKYDVDANGLGESKITGIMETPALVYGHKFEGVIEYLSARYLPEWEEKRGRKSHNPASALAGPKRAYRNSLYRHRHSVDDEKGALLYVVEGQGDGVTNRQFGVPCVALCGSQWKNLVESGEVADWLNDYEEIIYVTDADAAGEKVVTGKNNDYEMMNALGAMLWVGRTENKTWTRPNGTEKTIKDVNDIAQYLMDMKADEKEHNRIFNAISMKAERIVVLAARYAGKLEGHAREKMVEKIVKPMILSIPEILRVNLTRALALALYPNVSKAEAATAFNKWLKAQEKAAAEVGESDDGLPEIETYGGWFRDRENKDSGHLVELYYDREAQKLRLAWAHIKSLKDNEREIGWGKTLTLENKILVPPVYDQTIQEEIEFHSSAIKFPSKVGEKHTTAEIIKMDAEFYKKFFYAEDKSVFKFSAVWAVNTWVYDSFDTINMLRCMGPAGSGKSDLMYLVGLTCYRFAVTAATSSAKSHEGLAKLYHATDMIDEYDSALQRDDGTLAGYMKARPMRRMAHSFKMMEVMTPNGKTFIPSNTPIYGPTMTTGYKPTKDKGLESRFMTFHLTKTDMITLDRDGYEPGYYPPELEEEAEEIRNISLRWRLETWMPRIDLTKEEHAKHKINDVLVDARTNQLFRAAKVMAIKQGDMDLFNDLFTIGRVNYEDQLLELSGSFEAMVLRAVLAADIAKDLEDGIKPKASLLYAPKVAGYKDLVKVGKVGKYGVVRYILYKDLAKILNELFDLENIDETDEEKKRRKKTQSQTAGKVCHEAFRLPVDRRGDGFVVVLNKDRLDIARMRLGLDLENDYNPNYMGDEEVKAAAPVKVEPVQTSLTDYVPSPDAKWMDDYVDENE
jgi:DNA primase